MVSSSLPRFSKVDGPQIFLQVQELSQQRHGQDQSGNAAEDGAGDKVRAEDAGVPHGHGGHGEIPGDDGVHGDGYRHDHHGHDVHGGFQARAIAAACPASPAPGCDRSSCGSQWQASRTAAKSGIVGRYRKVVLPVRYVEMAKKSQASGERKLGQMWRSLG